MKFVPLRLIASRAWLAMSAAAVALVASIVLTSTAASRVSQDKSPADVPNAAAKSEAEMKSYTEPLAGTDASFDMVPIRGGKFFMGSPDSEPNRKDDEGPRHEVVVDPFWMGKCEVTWDEFELWMFSLEKTRRETLSIKPLPLDLVADAVTRPTKPYTDMSFGMGKEKGKSRFPVICMTQLAAKTYCEWISAKSGRYYRLPTEAEWEYACRAGTKTAFSFGDDPKAIGDYAWFGDNCLDVYHQVGQKKPNPWGLYDMHGNVAEWCLDQYVPDFYAKSAAESPAKSPYAKPTTRYPRVARGGSWQDDPEFLRSATRLASEDDWSIQDPQIPKSIWYHTDAIYVGFRVIRPLREPSPDEKAAFGPDKAQQ